jgi:hypothetical protein
LGSISSFKLLAPQSPSLTNSNLVGYTLNENNYGLYSDIISFNLGIKTTSQPKNTFKIGLTYMGNLTTSGYAYKTDMHRIDTFTSSQTGQQIFVDSSSNKTINPNYTTSQLQLDLGVRFQTNSKYRLVLFTAMDLGVASTFNANTIIYNSTSSSYKNILLNSTFSSYQFGTVTDQTYENKNGYALSAAIPLGIDYRMGKRSNFWKHLHLFGEIKPGLIYRSIPEIKNYTTAFVQSTIGFKVKS